MPNSRRWGVALLGVAGEPSWDTRHLTFEEPIENEACNERGNQGGEEGWLKMLMNILCGYTGGPEPLSSLLICMHVPVCLRSYFDIIDQTLRSYHLRGRY